MSEDSRFTNREIQLMFKNIEILLLDIKKDISGFDQRIIKLEKKVEELEKFQTRALMLWSAAVVLVGWIINNFKEFVL